MSINRVSFTRAVEQMIDLLEKNTSWEEGLYTALQILNSTLGIINSSIHKLVYSTVNDFHMLPIGPLRDENIHPERNEFGPERLEKDAIQPSEWDRLKKGSAIFGNDALAKKFKCDKPLMVVPLKSDEGLFGILFIDVSKVESDLERTQEGINSFCSIVKLWLNKLNALKQKDDILDILPYPTCILRPDHQIVVWNQAFVDRTGWEKHRILGKSDYSHAIPFYGKRRPCAPDLLLDPDPEWESKYHEFNRNGDVINGLAYCPEMLGGGIFLTYKTSLLRDINNRVAGAIHCVRDVTKEKEVEEELRRSESRYRTITEFAGIGMLLMTKSEIVYHNEFVSDLFKSLNRNVSIKNISELIHPEDRDEVFKCIDGLYNLPSKVSRFEFRIKDGSKIIYFRAQAGILKYEEKPTVHLIMDDVTDQKILAEKARINEMKLYHEDRLTSLGVMAAGIAHELNQPLNVIRVTTDGLLFGADEGWSIDGDEILEDMKMISDQVTRMSEVIESIRDFSREDKWENIQEVDLNQAVENIFSMIGRQVEARGISAEKKFFPELPLVSANMHRLEQVIMNLVVNAQQAFHACRREDKILRVETGFEDGQVWLEVQDNATGVPDKLERRIFDPFFTTKVVGQGTGLGLSISKSILNDYLGEITAFNNAIGGATFRVTLPIEEAKGENTVDR